MAILFAPSRSSLDKLGFTEFLSAMLIADFRPCLASCSVETSLVMIL